MSERPLRSLVVIACALVWTGATAARAWARKGTPKAAPKEERLQEPEAPPPSFVAPPPGYEPPPPWSPGNEPSGPPPPPYEEPLPGFFTLDRMDASTRVGASLGWHKIDDVDLGDAFVMRLEPFGQYVLPNQAGGLYGRLPIAHTFAFGADDATGVGNLELGGFFLPTRKSDLILRAGLAAGIASEGTGAVANLASRFERLTDYVLIGPKYTSLRLSGSTVRQWDMIFLRADLGLDFVLDKPSALSGETSVFGRGNIALGVRAAGTADFTLELVNLAAFNGTSVPSGLANHLFHTLALSVRSQGADQFHFGLVFPLDDAVRGDAFVVSLGYQHVGSF